jgi:hypothetical protein
MERSAALLESSARERERRRVEATMSFKDVFDLATTGRRSPLQEPQPAMKRGAATLGIHPWLGSAKGYSHSETKFRLSYLRACLWSTHALTSDVVIGVVSEEDRRLISDAGLPVLEIVVFPSLPSTTALPVALVQWAQRALSAGGKYSRAAYRFVDYSEADQVLVLRPGAQRRIESFLERYNRRVVVPHRLVPYPAAVLHKFNRSLPASVARLEEGALSLQDMHRAAIGSSAAAPPARGQGQGKEWTALKCCLPRQNCESRDDWRHPWDRKTGSHEHFLPVVWLHGLATALGNADFYHESYRVCTLSPWEESEVCP